MKVTDKGLESSIVKFFDEKIQKELLKAANAKKDDLLFFVADASHKIMPAKGIQQQDMCILSCTIFFYQRITNQLRIYEFVNSYIICNSLIFY